MSNRTWLRTIETNIIKTYLAATPEDIDAGLHWYNNAQYEAMAIAVRWDIPVWASIGVIAALSPGCEWGRNVLDAEELIRAFKQGTDIPAVGVYGSRNTEKALRILRGETPDTVLGGPKVRAFFYNILFPDGDGLVTVDRHTKALAYNLMSKRSSFASDDVLSAVKRSEYDYIAWHYKIIARRYGLVPSQLQAICWTTWKRLGEER